MRKKQLLNRKLEGTTIIEVLIALAITSFCGTLAVLIYLNIQKSSLPFFKLRAAESAAVYLEKTLKEKAFFEETTKDDAFTLRRFVAPNAQFPDCNTLRIVVFDSEKKKLFELESNVQQSAGYE